MKKNKIVSLIALLTASVLLLVGSVFAWFVIYDMMSGVDLTIAKIDSLITLYKGEDRNYDGNLDPEEVIIDGVTVTRPKYTQIKDPVTAEGNENASIELSMEIEDFMPTQKHTFKFHVLNMSDARNEIRIAFVGYDAAFWTGEGDYDFAYFLQCLRVMSVTVNVLNEDGLTVADSKGKIYLANALNEEINEGDEIFELDLLQGIIIHCPPLDNDVEIQLIFEFETYESLKQAVLPTVLNLTQEQYNNYGGEIFSRAFMLPLLRIYLEIP